MALNIGGKIDRISGKELSYQQFVERYLEKNEPVLLTGLMDGWRACRDWVNGNGQPNLHFIAQHFGKSKVQVAECGKREFTDQKRVEMSVSEFISHWLQLSTGKCSDALSCNGSDQSLLYLKDWHFVKEYPQYVAYTTPPFFLDDWLNIYLDSHHMHRDPNMHHDKTEINCSDYRFVYMGAKGTWTPLHADVFRSYSWSANVCGKKQWYFLPPSQCHLLFDRNMKNSVYNIFDDVSQTNFPSFKKAIWLECTQEQNEIIFVPSGWYHQVHNQEDTISINHNWFNGYNLSWVWNLLLKDYKEAKEYIDDIRDICDDFEGLCQRNLAANTGMNFYDFFIFIARFSFANLIRLHNLLKNGQDLIQVPSADIQHLFTNLISIQNVASNMKNMESFMGENLSNFRLANCCILPDIRKILEEPEFVDLYMALNRTYRKIDEQQKQDSETENTSISSKECLLLNSLKSDVVDLGFIESFGHEVSGPKDLIRIIDNMFENRSRVDDARKIVLLSKLNQHENSVVL